MAKKDIIRDDLTVATKIEDNKYHGPTVQVFLQPLEDSGDDGIPVDQFEHVQIANEEGVQEFHILRGENVEIPVPAYIALKEKYGKKI